MGIFNSMNMAATGLTANRLRMDVVSSNINNMETTRGKYVDGKWQPYRRKMVVLQEQGGQFSSFLHQAMNVRDEKRIGNGVKVTKIVEDNTPFKLVYNPEHPDANAEGYVQMPNVEPLKEMMDLMSSTRNYEANLTAFNASKSMLLKTLEMGKQG